MPVLTMPAVDSVIHDQPGAQQDLDELVQAAKRGDRAAWNSLVARYSPLVSAVARRYRLSPSDAEDVSQTVWLKLVQNLAQLREAKALPGWLKTTTQHEASRCLSAGRRADLVDPTVLELSLEPSGEFPEVDAEILRFEARRAVPAELAELQGTHRVLLVMLHAEQQPSYRRIGQALGMPSGSIGPTRARCLEKLRKTSAVRTLMQSA